MTYIIYEHRDDIVGVVLIWGRRASDYFLPLLEANGETGNQNHLQDFRL